MSYLSYFSAIVLVAFSVAAAEAPSLPRKPTPEEFQKMTPAERTNWVRELRKQYEKLTPEQQEAQRRVWRERLEGRIAELKKKKDAGKLTESEAKQLGFLEQRLKLWDKAGKEGIQPPSPPQDCPKPAER